MTVFPLANGSLKDEYTLWDFLQVLFSSGPHVMSNFYFMDSIANASLNLSISSTYLNISS